MKRRLRVYKKTVSIVNETSTDMYESLVGEKKGFLLESYDKNYDRYTFFGKEPEEIITSRGNALVIRRNDGTEEVRQGNPLERLKEYYSEFDIVKENEELSFSGGLVGNLGYDFVRYAEVLPDNNPDEIGIETIQMMLIITKLSAIMCARRTYIVWLKKFLKKRRRLCCHQISRIVETGVVYTTLELSVVRLIILKARKEYLISSLI